ncbi:2-hydroxyisoflavanone dehydratase-like [Thalictrum thalictroides]|uniref:2-hydroxyisoflavanone dehydratase-like n=1 Tax=Thalictrum thalictroides TaxID=46969 RepID=A0A7J6WP76_THATH|nr:2-hydroxyisoflavanone dehydratase-like [Thalictrum thalictroides]
MDQNKVELDHEFLPFLRAYKNGYIERLIGSDIVSSSIDPQTGVSSKDVTIQNETGLSARLYIPKTISKHQKLPLLIYFHGGSFLIESAFSSVYHQYMNSVVAEANVVAMSVEYRLAPEHPLPIAYNDSWEAIQWVASHSNGEGSESWLNDYVAFDRVFLGGDSAGANIVHNMAMRAGEVELKNCLKIHGIILVQPYFWGAERIGAEESDLAKRDLINKMWIYACPSTIGHDDPYINPLAPGAPSLCKLGCSRVLVLIAGEDVFRDRDFLYYETLRKCGWGGVAEVIETEGEDHVFHLLNPTCNKAISMIMSLASYMNQDNTTTSK